MVDTEGDGIKGCECKDRENSVFKPAERVGCIGEIAGSYDFMIPTGRFGLLGVSGTGDMLDYLGHGVCMAWVVICQLGRFGSYSRPWQQILSRLIAGDPAFDGSRMNNSKRC